MTYPTIMPAITLDFANSQQLDPRITFSRSSSATYINSAGQVAYAAEHEARFDHDPVTGECLGLLIEESRTNLAIYSNTFASFCSNQTPTPTPLNNQGIAPDGTNTAWLIPAGATGACQRNYNIPTNSDFYSWTIYVKALSSDAVASFNLTGIYQINFSPAFTFSTGIFSGASNGTVAYVGNGWYKLTQVYQNNGKTLFINRIDINSGNDGKVLYWGNQIEVGPTPSSYIPTTTSAVTRSADIAQVSTADIYGDEFTIINKPFGVSSGSDTLHLQGHPHVERAVVYNEDLSQEQINTVTGVDEFWQWRILGSSFALPTFVTDGQVTVDWGDGTVETLTTSEHTFTNGGGYHDVGFRLDSGTYFRPYINDNASHDTKVVALGPAPESMKLDGQYGFYGCVNLEAFDATVDTTGGTNFSRAWQGCSSLTSFPLINTSSGTNFTGAWNGCSNLTSFPLINTAAGTSFYQAWADCNSLTSFPLINTAAGTTFRFTWNGCSNLTSFPLIDTSSGTNFGYAWYNCNSLTSFPQIDTSSGTDFTRAWDGCSNLNNIGVAPGATTSLPLFDFSSATTLSNCFKNCSSITTVPVFDASNATDVSSMFYGCTNLNNFPGITLRTTANVSLASFFASCTSLTNFTLFDTSTVTNMGAMFYLCTGLTSFPASFDTSAAVNLASTWADCQNLTSFPALNTANATSFKNAWARNYGLTDFPLLDTTSITTCEVSWYNATNLANFPANMFDTTGTLLANAFNNAWLNCALTAQSIENILVSLDTNGATGITLTISGGTNAAKTTWSAAAVTAYDNLIVKGWTITFNA